MKTRVIHAPDLRPGYWVKNSTLHGLRERLNAGEFAAEWPSMWWCVPVQEKIDRCINRASRWRYLPADDALRIAERIAARWSGNYHRSIDAFFRGTPYDDRDFYNGQCLGDERRSLKNETDRADPATFSKVKRCVRCHQSAPDHPRFYHTKNVYGVSRLSFCVAGDMCPTCRRIIAKGMRDCDRAACVVIECRRLIKHIQGLHTVPNLRDVREIPPLQVTTTGDARQLLANVATAAANGLIDLRRAVVVIRAVEQINMSFYTEARLEVQAAHAGRRSPKTGALPLGNPTAVIEHEA